MSLKMSPEFLISVSYLLVVSVVCFLFLFIEVGVKGCCRIVWRIKEKDHISMSVNDLKMLHSHLGFWKYYWGFPSHSFPEIDHLVLFSMSFLTSESTLLWSFNKLYVICSLLATCLYYFFLQYHGLHKETHKLTHMETLVMRRFHGKVIYWELITKNHKINN